MTSPLAEAELDALQERLEQIGGPLFAHDGVRQTDSANVLCLIAEIRASRAQAPAPVPVEAVARIIDPSAFAERLPPDTAKNIGNHRRRQTYALTKAGAILALRGHA